MTTNTGIWTGWNNFYGSGNYAITDDTLNISTDAANMSALLYWSTVAKPGERITIEYDARTISGVGRITASSRVAYTAYNTQLVENHSDFRSYVFDVEVPTKVAGPQRVFFGVGIWRGDNTTAGAEIEFVLRNVIRHDSGGRQMMRPDTFGLLEPETRLILSSLLIEPNKAHTQLIDDTVYQLKQAGIWPKLDCLYFLAAPSTDIAAVNWINPGQYNLKEVNSPTFTANVGYSGRVDAVTPPYLQTGFNPIALAGTDDDGNGVADEPWAAQFRMDNNSMFVWATYVEDTPAYIIGSRTHAISPFPTSYNTRVYGRDGAESGVYASGVTRESGLYAMSRDNSADFDMYVNGVNAGTVTQASGTMYSESIQILKRSANTDTCNANIVRAAGFGTSLSDVEHASLQNIIGAYLLRLDTGNTESAWAIPRLNALDVATKRSTSWWDTVFAPLDADDVPTITVSTTQQTTGDLITPSASLTDAYFRYDGCIGVTSPASGYVWASTSTSNVNYYCNPEFVTVSGSSTIELRVYVPSAGNKIGVRVIVDSKLHSLTLDRFTSTPSSDHYIKIVFPTARVRQITVELEGIGLFGGVIVPTGHTITRPPRSVRRPFGIIGDSFCRGSDYANDGASGLETFAYYVARLSGADRIVNFAISGTGWSKPGSTSIFGSHTAEVLSSGVAALIAVGSRNDSSYTSQLAADAFAALDALSPIHYIAVGGPAQVAFSTVNDKVKDATLRAGRDFVNVLDVIDSSLVHTDNIHPSAAGHVALARAFYAGMSRLKLDSAFAIAAASRNIPMTEYVWDTRPPASEYPGQEITITDVGVAGSRWRSNGTRWVNMHPIVLGTLPAPVTRLASESTAESAAVWTMTVRGGIMGSNSMIQLLPLATCNNSATNKTMRVKAAGTSIGSFILTTVVAVQPLILFRNLNNLAIQKTFTGNSSATGSISTAPAATTVNTAADWDLTVTLQAANSTNGDTITLDAMTVVLF